MKVARLICTALALTLMSGLTTWSYACDRNKSATATSVSTESKATAKSATKATTAVAATHAMICTPEMMAACKASVASGGPDLCVGKPGAATAASASAGDACCATKSAKNAAKAVPATPKPSGMRVQAGVVTPELDPTAAMTASSTPATPTTIYLAGANGSCGSKSKSASTSTASGQCTGHGMASVAAYSDHQDCEACADMADCSGTLDAAGAHRQTVRLKNGLMYVYTADSPRNVNTVQTAVARRVERMARTASTGEKARLCAECKAMRGAMASGKLNREVVNIEGGSLTLVTSSDPAVVAKLHAMASDPKVSARIKS